MMHNCHHRMYMSIRYHKSSFPSIFSSFARSSGRCDVRMCDDMHKKRFQTATAAGWENSIAAKSFQTATAAVMMHTSATTTQRDSNSNDNNNNNDNDNVNKTVGSTEDPSVAVMSKNQRKKMMHLERRKEIYKMVRLIYYYYFIIYSYIIIFCRQPLIVVVRFL